MTIEESLHLAVQRHRAGKLAEAEAIYRQVLAAEPNHPDAFHLLGCIAYQTGQYQIARELIGKAVAMNPRHAPYHADLGPVLDKLGLIDEAIASCRRAIALNPNVAEVHKNLGAAMAKIGQNQQAIASFRKAIALQPDLAEAHWNLGRMLLTLGDFEHGWQEFDWRLSMQEFKLNRDFPQRQWKGEEIAGKTILLHAEGGFGDLLNFVRYVPMVARRGATVLLECQPAMISLMKQLDCVSRLIARGEPLPQFDCHCPLQSLPLALRTTLASIPAQSPYLVAPPELVAKWADKLGTDSSLRVGLAWAGSSKAAEPRSRSLGTFAALAAVKGVTFYSLQKGSDANQPVPAGMKLLALADPHADFADTAALAANLDLVISVDTSVAHLAGALGRPVWTLITFSPDFRWLINRDDSPWYPTMRLFRQTHRTDWDQPVQRMMLELTELAARRIEARGP